MGYASQKFATGIEFDDWVGEKDNKDNVIFNELNGKATILTVEVAANETIEFTPPNSYNHELVDWGDGTINSFIGAQHTYTSAGTYNIRILGLTTISPDMFKSCKNLTGVTIDDNVSQIEYSAFQGCSNLTRITFGRNVSLIGVNAFEGCKGLTSIVLPDSITKISGNSFRNCDNLTRIAINARSVPSIATNAFSSLASVGTIKMVVPYESLSAYKADEQVASLEAGGRIEVDAYIYASAAQGKSGSLTIATSNWSSNAYTVTVEDLGENDAIFFTPSTREDKTAIEEASVFISTAGSVVTFTCEDTPASAINFKYFICRGM